MNKILEILQSFFETKILKGRKTYLAMIGLALGAVGALLTGEASLVETLLTLGEAFGIGFLRAGVAGGSSA